MDEHPRFSTHYETRAYWARMAAMEEHDELVEQLKRLESEINDVIREAEYLLTEGQIGDMAQVIASAKASMTVVQNRRHIMEKCR